MIKIKELREEEEDLVKDEDQTEDQTEDQIGDQPEDQIGEQREDPTEDEDLIEDQEKDQPADMALAKEVVEEHTLIPKASMKADIAQCVRRKVITVYFTALNYRNMFLEDLEPNLFQEKYVSSVSPLLETKQIVFILFQETTMTGCASRVKLTSYSARIVRNIKHRKIG